MPRKMAISRSSATVWEPGKVPVIRIAPGHCQRARKARTSTTKPGVKWGIPDQPCSTAAMNDDTLLPIDLPSVLRKKLS